MADEKKKPVSRLKQDLTLGNRQLHCLSAEENVKNSHPARQRDRPRR
jgi:hypothetical protein